MSRFILYHARDDSCGPTSYLHAVLGDKIRTMSQVDLLYRLQQAENEIREDKKRLAEVIRLQSESVELTRARQRAAAAETELHRRRVIQKDLNLELDGLSDKAKRSENRLYSGLVTNPKELEDLQHELESLGRRMSSLEDDLLEAMIAAEEAEEDEQAASDTLAQVETEWVDTVVSCKEEQTNLLARIGELAEQKNQLIELALPETMTAFEDALRRAGEIAVAALKDGRCRGCLVSVSANQIKAADEGKMVNCDSCGRILCPQ
jgi:predicted  nucleic acid-binding Zn-ribbon protein